MADEVLESFSRFKVISKEEEGIAIGKEDVRKCEEECGRSLLVRNKQSDFMGLKITLSLLWNQEDAMKVVELSSNFFQFIFESQKEKDRILQKRPWFFDNQLLVLQQWHSEL